MQTCSVISVLMSRVKGRPHQGREPEKHSVERKPPPTPLILNWVMVWSNYHYFCVNFVVKKKNRTQQQYTNFFKLGPWMLFREEMAKEMTELLARWVETVPTRLQ